MCAVSGRCLGIKGGFPLITLLIWWVGLVCKLRVFNACHLAICKCGLVVDPASMPMVAVSNAMGMGGFGEAVVELDKHKDTGQ